MPEDFSLPEKHALAQTLAQALHNRALLTTIMLQQAEILAHLKGVPTDAARQYWDSIRQKFLDEAVEQVRAPADQGASGRNQD